MTKAPKYLGTGHLNTPNANLREYSVRDINILCIYFSVHSEKGHIIYQLPIVHVLMRKRILYLRIRD